MAKKQTLLEALAEVREAMRPVFDEQRRVYAEKSPAILARLTLAGVAVDSIGGNCPVQAEGKIGGRHKFYFRARGDSWQFHVAANHKQFFDGEWQIDRDYGSWPDAGWMPHHEALEFIEQGVAEYRSSRRKKATPIALPQGEI